MSRKRSTRKSKKAKRSVPGGDLKVLHPNAGGLMLGAPRITPQCPRRPMDLRSANSDV